jgi:S-disulfanyl-L-cysteine oxidoreductase SoxD
MSRSLKLTTVAMALVVGWISAQAGPLGLGREATPAEIAAWDISIRPDGKGLPEGKGTVKQGEEIFQERCAACHGEFGEGKDRWPVLAGGHGTLTADRPEKTVGSYWPYASTVMDYVRRAMPFGNAQSLTPDELYAVTAYILQMNDVIKDPAFELSKKNFTTIKMPNEGGFFLDDREVSEKHFWTKSPCMMDCKKSTEIIGRAMNVDVTPDGKSGPKVD